MTDRQHRGRSADDEELLAAIYRRHSAAVLAYALRRCSPHDAADVVSETFVVAWRRIGDVPAEPAVKPWLFGVARRVLANQRRGFRRRSALVRKVASHLAPTLAVIPSVDHHPDNQIVFDALRRLSPADRELLTLATWEQLTPGEIAVVLGVSGPVARKRLFRARSRMAVVLEQLESGWAGEERPAGGDPSAPLPSTEGMSS